jgi:hypothetical protein
MQFSYRNYTEICNIHVFTNGMFRPFNVRCGHVEVTLRLAVYRQSVCLGAKPLRLTIRGLFLQPNHCGHGSYVSEEKIGVSYEYAWPFVKCTYRTCSMLLKIIPCAL